MNASLRNYIGSFVTVKYSTEELGIAGNKLVEQILYNLSNRMKIRLTAISLVTLLLIVIISIISLTNHNNNHKNIEMASVFRPDNSPVKTTIILDYIVITETPIPTPTKKPTPIPSHTPIPVTSAELNALFIKYSNQQNVDKEILKRIAVCESKLNPQASNGKYAGLFQFSESAWITIRRAMNFDQNLQLRYNPEEAIKTAAFKIATEGPNAWPNCSKQKEDI